MPYINIKRLSLILLFPGIAILIIYCVLSCKKNYDDEVALPRPVLKSGSIIALRARGTEGSEQIQLKVDNTVVAVWLLTTRMEYYSVSVSGPGAVVVEFLNGDIAGDVQIDFTQYNGTTYEAEDQQVNTGVWQNNSCGGSFSEWLHCSGYIRFPDFNSHSSNS